MPAVAHAHPELRPVLRTLEQDHVMIARLLDDYAERRLPTVLDTLELTADRSVALGPL